ncbi:MAG: formate dehydrogenase accessory sulfurtransferase FdhD [Methylophilaceae bacterium]
MLDKTITSANAPQSMHTIKKWKDNHLVEGSDCLAEEVPIALIYNGVSHAVMLATPQDLEDFALGFSLTEGILQNKSELYDIEIVLQANGVELQLNIASERFVTLKERRRSMVGRTGCGLCGAESLEQVMRVPQASANIITQPLQAISWHSLQFAHQNIQPMQTLQQATGATHACAWADTQGNILLVREDVGRHNAMDKLIGALAKNPPNQAGFVLTTSRASYEMVQKIASVGINMLAAISAPTGLAVRIAQAFNVTLLGFVRNNQHVIYTHPQRVQHQAE